VDLVGDSDTEDNEAAADDSGGAAEAALTTMGEAIEATTNYDM
jgi:hypothetical protein